MNRRQILLTAGVAATAAAAGAGWAWWCHIEAPSSRGTDSAAERALWALRFEQPAGGELVMADLRGQPLLLNFWATWCPPCIEEMPLLDRFQQDRQASGWRVVGLAVDRLEPVQDFLAKHPMGFTTGLAGMDGMNLSRSLGNTGGALPFSAVFGRDGRLLRTHLGPLTASDLAAWGDLAA